MKTAFVTGGTGFVGLNLLEQLQSKGWQVTVLHRANSNLSRLAPFKVALTEGDITDDQSLLKAIPPKVDVVFHTAANTSVWSKNNRIQERDNVIGTRNVVRASLESGAKRLIHTSTWNTFGMVHEVMNEESPQLGFKSWINYDRTKYQAEQEVRQGIREGLDAVIINPSHIIGRYDTHNWAKVVRLIYERRLPGIPPGAGSFCHAEQVALAHIAAAEKGVCGENYLLGGTDANFVDVVRIVGELTGRKVPKRPLPAWLMKLVARVHVIRAGITGKEPDLTPEAAAMITAHPRIVSDKAERVLGYRKVPLRDMLEDSYAWLKRAGLLATD